MGQGGQRAARQDEARQVQERRDPIEPRRQRRGRHELRQGREGGEQVLRVRGDPSILQRLPRQGQVVDERVVEEERRRQRQRQEHEAGGAGRGEIPPAHRRFPAAAGRQPPGRQQQHGGPERAEEAAQEHGRAHDPSTQDEVGGLPLPGPGRQARQAAGPRADGQEHHAPEQAGGERQGEPLEGSHFTSRFLMR